LGGKKTRPPKGLLKTVSKEKKKRAKGVTERARKGLEKLGL